MATPLTPNTTKVRLMSGEEIDCKGCTSFKAMKKRVEKATGGKYPASKICFLHVRRARGATRRRRGARAGEERPSGRGGAAHAAPRRGFSPCALEPCRLRAARLCLRERARTSAPREKLQKIERWETKGRARPGGRARARARAPGVGARRDRSNQTALLLR